MVARRAALGCLEFKSRLGTLMEALNGGTAIKKIKSGQVFHKKYVKREK